MTRREAREQAFMVLFEKIFDTEATVTEIIKNAEENDLIKLNGFAKEILSKYEPNSEEIDAVISEKAVGWELSRLPKVSLAIMRLAVTEIKYCDNIPDSVAVSEAVDIAKKYGTPDDASYINGVLGAVTRA